VRDKPGPVDIVECRTSDSLAFRDTSLGQRVLRQTLPAGFFLVGDAAYTLTNSLLTPIAGTLASMGIYADSYNFHLSQLRINIECAFGILVRRWGVLWRPLECAFYKMPHVVLCCMRLHQRRRSPLKPATHVPNLGEPYYRPRPAQHVHR
jgi:hypothetical protein